MADHVLVEVLSETGSSNYVSVIGAGTEEAMVEMGVKVLEFDLEYPQSSVDEFRQKHEYISSDGYMLSVCELPKGVHLRFSNV